MRDKYVANSLNLSLAENDALKSDRLQKTGVGNDRYCQVLQVEIRSSDFFSRHLPRHDNSIKIIKVIEHNRKIRVVINTSG